MSVETHLLYAVHGPIVAALLVSGEGNSVNAQKPSAVSALAWQEGLIPGVGFLISRFR